MPAAVDTIPLAVISNSYSEALEKAIAQARPTVEVATQIDKLVAALHRAAEEGQPATLMALRKQAVQWLKDLKYRPEGWQGK